MLKEIRNKRLRVIILFQVRCSCHYPLYLLPMLFHVIQIVNHLGRFLAIYCITLMVISNQQFKFLNVIIKFSFSHTLRHLVVIRWPQLVQLWALTGNFTVTYNRHLFHFMPYDMISDLYFLNICCLYLFSHTPRHLVAIVWP
jgi:hypothetical protein